MPRLSNSLLRHANRIDRLLPLLLQSCRDLNSACNELRWLREHVNVRNAPSLSGLCRQRATGKPLQYILGSQSFGELDILCEPGVLIPRLETESYTSYLAARILGKNGNYSSGDAFRVLDLCSGTGCISLLLYSLLFQHIPKLQVTGIDIEPKAITLARRNLKANIGLGHLPTQSSEDICFMKGDVLGMEDFGLKSCEVLIANPPYISPSSFDKETSRSTRNFEPKRALVPVPLDRTSVIDYENPTLGDVFYDAIFQTALKVRARLVLVEIAGSEQAKRIILTAHDFFTKQQPKRTYKYEIWHDELPMTKDHGHSDAATASCRHGNVLFTRIGTGNARTVVVQL